MAELPPRTPDERASVALQEAAELEALLGSLNVDTKVVVVRNHAGGRVARVVMQILKDSATQQPVLDLQDPYIIRLDDSTPYTKEQIKALMRSFLVKKARQMGIAYLGGQYIKTYHGLDHQVVLVSNVSRAPRRYVEEGDEIIVHRSSIIMPSQNG